MAIFVCVCVCVCELLGHILLPVLLLDYFSLLIVSLFDYSLIISR